MWLFALFVLVPLVEIALFITVGGWLTLWPTLAIVVATALLGTALVRQQGARVLMDVQRALDQFGDPLAPLAHGAMILFAGALLLTPGFLTDAVGFALLVPAVRAGLLRWIVRHRVHVRVFGARPAEPGPRNPRRGPDDDVIDADFRDLTPEEKRGDPAAGSRRPPERGRERLR